MNRRLLTAAGCLILTTGLAVPTFAAFEPSVENSYNMAVQAQDSLNGLDVTVFEKCVSASTNIAAEKQVNLQVTGIAERKLQADIEVVTQEGSAETYYRDDYRYTTTADGKVKEQMDRADIWNVVNSHIYLDMTSNYLRMLCSDETADGNIVYSFAATAETLGDYSKKLLGGYQDDQNLKIDSLQGTMVTDADGHILERTMNMVYTVGQDEKEETFYTQIEADFHQNGDVAVKLPDLSAYKESKPEKPAVTITPLLQTVYVTADVNVRAAGDMGAVIIGGFPENSGITQTGYTSDGWVQVQYNDTTGYIWGEYVTTTKPVITKNSSGVMYATAQVNIRDDHSTDGKILGTLNKGDSIEITGTTDNNWIRVKYNGQRGYVYADYLSWSEPVSETYVEDANVWGTVVDASMGSLTIQKYDGTLMLFNTSYASMQLADTIYTGDTVQINYTGSGAPYTAITVVDNVVHHAVPASKVTFTVDGVVTMANRKVMEVSCSDGVYRTFNIKDADIERMDYPVMGDYVMVSWMSATNGGETRNIDAVRVM